MNEKSIALTARFYEFRETGRRLLGDAYESETARAKDLIHRMAEVRYDGNYLEAFEHFIRDMQEAGISCVGTELRLACALVDLLEEMEDNPDAF